MRKVLIIFLLSVFSLILVAVSILLIYSIRHQETIEKSLVEYINTRFDNAIHISDFHLTYLNNFPNARLMISDVVLHDDTTEVLRIGSVQVLFNLRNFLNDSIKINRIIINDAILNSRIDINGKKPVIRFSEEQPVKKQTDKHVHIYSPDLELNNLKLNLSNEYKKNETYITVYNSIFSLDIDKDLVTLSGYLEGQLDSLISGGTTLFSKKKVIGKNLVLKINSEENHTYLESGFMETSSLTIHPSISFKKQEDGNIVKIRFASEGNLDEHLRLINLPDGIDLEQLNRDAEINMSYNQDGLVNPLTRPFNQLIFEIKEAGLKSPSLPYPVRKIHIIGNYNNGEMHGPETSNLIVDTLNFEIEESFVNASLLLSNLKDPIVKGHFVSEIDLNHIFHEDKITASGKIIADIFVDGKISEFEQLHLDNKQHAYGNIIIDSADILFRKTGQHILIPSGNINLDNHFVRIKGLKGQIMDSFFDIEAEINNLDQFILGQNTQLTGKISIISDYINLSSMNFGNDTIKNENSKIRLPNVDLDLSIQAEQIEGNFGTINKFIVMGNLDHDILNINTLTFGYKAGKIESNLNIELGHPDGPHITGGKINAQFNHLNIDEILDPPNQDTGSKKKRDLPQNINLELELLVKDGMISGKTFNNLRANVIFSKGDINVKNLDADLFGGNLSLSSDIKYDSDGVWLLKAKGNTRFPYLSVRELLNDFHMEDTSPDQPKEIPKLPEMVDIEIGIAVDSLLYGQKMFNNIHTGIKISRDEIEIEDFSIDLNEGLGQIDLQLANYLKHNPRLTGNIELFIDSANVQTIYETISGFSTNEKHAEEKIAHTIPNNIEIDVNLNARYLQYQNLVIENLHLSSRMRDGILSVSDLNFNTSGGHIKFSGLCLQYDDKTIDGHFYSTGTELSIAPLISSFSNTDLSDGTHGNIEGRLAYEAEGLFKVDSLLYLVHDQNLFYADIIVEEGKIVNNPQLDNTLSFIGQKAKDSILIKNSEFQIFVNGTDIVIQDMLVNNSISDMNIFGRYYQYDSAINLNFRVSLMDLFFRTKKKRYVDTEQGRVRLFKDLSLFIELDNSSPKKNKIKIHPKRKHRLRRKDLSNQIAEIITKYRTRLNKLYLDVEPKMQDSKLPLEALNK
jgi:hypothetical protein